MRNDRNFGQVFLMIQVATSFSQLLKELKPAFPNLLSLFLFIDTTNVRSHHTSLWLNKSSLCYGLAKAHDVREITSYHGSPPIVVCLVRRHTPCETQRIHREPWRRPAFDTRKLVAHHRAGERHMPLNTAEIRANMSLLAAWGGVSQYPVQQYDHPDETDKNSRTMSKRSRL